MESLARLAEIEAEWHTNWRIGKLAGGAFEVLLEGGPDRKRQPPLGSNGHTLEQALEGVEALMGEWWATR